jgi:hypothetical protein
MCVLFADSGLAHFFQACLGIVTVVFLTGVLVAIYGVIAVRRGELPFSRPKGPIVVVKPAENVLPLRKRPKNTTALIVGIVSIILGIGLVALALAVIVAFFCMID